MEHEFPPPAILDPFSVWPNVLMFAVLIAAGIVLYLRSGRRGSPQELILWTMFIPLPIILSALIPDRQGESRDLAILISTLLTMLIWTVAAGGFVRAIVALETFGLSARARRVAGWAMFLALVVSLCVVAMMPDGGYPRPRARMSQCKRNLKDIGLAFHNWYIATGRLPDVDGSTGENPPLSWRVALLPYFDLTDLHARYDQSQSWDAEENLQVARTAPRNGLTCPAVPERYARDDRQRYFTAYIFPTGPQTAFPQGRGITFPEVTDGTTNTFLSTEAVGLNVPWTQPRDFDVAKQPLGVNLNGSRPGHSPGLISSYHLGGGYAVMLDGSARFVSEEVDPQVLKALTTASGGEEIGAWDEW